MFPTWWPVRLSRHVQNSRHVSRKLDICCELGELLELLLRRSQVHDTPWMKLWDIKVSRRRKDQIGFA